MAKPWEETWRTNHLDGREVECPDPSLPDDDAYRIAEVYMGSEDGTQARFDRARLVSAAPEMARALRSLIMYHGHIDDCPGRLHQGVSCYTRCESVRMALTKAGVPFP